MTWAYLDHNATSPLLPEAGKALREALDVFGNPSSVHGFGRRARDLVERARDDVAISLGAEPGDVVFTSGATEANALALAGAGSVLVSAIEHDSVRAWGSRRFGVNPNGIVDLDDLERHLQDRPAVVAVMLANNETGVVQPVREAARLARKGGARVHCDAVQAWGRLPFRIQDLEVDTLSISAHKAGGATGAGALVRAPDVDLDPLLRGGGQERSLRAGTENVPGIATLGAIAQLGCQSMERVETLRETLETTTLQRVPETVLIARGSPRLPNTAMLSLPGANNETLVIQLDLRNVAVGAGAACSSGKVGPSHVLEAMGIPDDQASGAIRISLGPTTSPADVDAFIQAWVDIANGRKMHRGA